MLNQVLKVSQEHVNSTLRMLSNSVTFLDFHISQGNVATYCRRGGNLCGIYIGNFLTNHLGKEFWKSVNIYQSYYEQTSRGILFWHTLYVCAHHRVCKTKTKSWSKRPDRKITNWWSYISALPLFSSLPYGAGSN